MGRREVQESGRRQVDMGASPSHPGAVAWRLAVGGLGLQWTTVEPRRCPSAVRVLVVEAAVVRTYVALLLLLSVAPCRALGSWRGDAVAPVGSERPVEHKPGGTEAGNLQACKQRMNQLRVSSCHPWSNTGRHLRDPQCPPPWHQQDTKTFSPSKKPKTQTQQASPWQTPKTAKCISSTSSAKQRRMG